MSAAVTLRALDEGLPVRLDAHGAAGLEDGVISRGHSNIVEPPQPCVVRSVSLHPGDDRLQVRHGDRTFTSQLEDLELEVRL